MLQVHGLLRSIDAHGFGGELFTHFRRQLLKSYAHYTLMANV